MSKDIKREQKDEKPKLCEECGVRLPWHVQSCSKARGYTCAECGARHPRHYPGCTQDVFGLGGWKMPTDRATQKALEEQYVTERRGADTEGRSTQPPPLPGEWPEPGQNWVFSKEIGRYLWSRVLQLRKAKDKAIRRCMAESLHEDIDALAAGRDLRVFLAELKKEA